MDKYKRTIEAYQLVKSGKFRWLGAKPMGEKDEEYKRTRKIELSPNDILIKSIGGNYNKINKNGAINIEIPDRKVICLGNMEFNEDYYKGGYDG